MPSGVVTRRRCGSSLINLPNPAAYWRLEEASGTRVDATGNSHDLNALSGTPGNGTGILGSALALVAASSQDVHRAAEAGLTLASDSTWWAWVNLASTPGGNFAYAMYKGDTFSTSGNAEWDIHFDNTRKPVVSIWRGTSQTTNIGVSALALSTWHLIIGRFTAADNKVYLSVDGSAFNTGVAAAGAPNTGTHQMTLGQLLGLGSTFFDGLVDEAGFAAVAFTDAQAGTLYNGGVGHYWASGAWN